MQKINLRDLYPDAYKTDVFVDVAEEVLAAIRDQQQDEEKEHPAEFHIVRFTLNQFAVAEFFDPRRGVACGGRVVDLVPFGEQACRIVDGEFLAREGVPQVERALVERNDLGHVDSQTALHDDDVLAGHLPNLVFFANFHRSILS